MTRLKTLLTASCLVAAAVSAPLAASATAQLIANGGFEDTALSPGAYSYPGQSGGWTPEPNPLDSWTYNWAPLINMGAASPWGLPSSGNASVQFAGVQGGSSIEQSFSVTAGQAAGALQLTWIDTGRSNFGGDQTYEVLINGSALSTTYTTTPGSTWNLESADLAGLLHNGVNTIEFLGLSQTDNTAFIDDVSITAVPEPAAWALMLVGFGGLGVTLRRKTALAEVRT